MWGEVLTHGVGVFVGVITVQYSDEVCMRYGSNGGMLKLRLVFHNIFKDRHEYGLKTLEGVVARHLIKCRVKIDFATDALDLRVRLPLPFYDRVELGQMGFVLTGEKQIAQSHLQDQPQFKKLLAEIDVNYGGMKDTFKSVHDIRLGEDHTAPLSRLDQPQHPQPAQCLSYNISADPQRGRQLCFFRACGHQPRHRGGTSVHGMLTPNDIKFTFPGTLLENADWSRNPENYSTFVPSHSTKTHCRKIPMSDAFLRTRRYPGRTLFILLALLLIIVPQAQAQKVVEEQEQTWFGYINQSRITDRSGLWVDLHLRLTDHYVNKKTMVLTRAGYIFYLHEHVRLVAGYTYAHRYGQSGSGRIPEHRPWQQIQWIERKKSFDLVQAFRVEERFRKAVGDRVDTDSYIFNWRFRYNIAFTIPLRGKRLIPKTPYLFFSNEVNVNAGKSIVNNYFDQNRSFVGLGYQFNASLHANLGPLFIFQQSPEPGRYNHTHAIRLYVYHNIDLRQTRKED